MDNGGSFARWQQIAPAQLAGAANLILGLGVAAIGFLITVLMNLQIDANDRWQIVAYLLFLASMLLFLGSSGFGIWLTVTRLRDFRARMYVARAAEQGADERQIERRRNLSRRLEPRSWRIFWWQLSVFGLALATGAAGAVLLALRWLTTGDISDTGCNI